jgi:hypothetical protein
MAAFNFTLAEARTLKDEYGQRLGTIADEEARFEALAALAELHDFDEEYEEARRHYHAAIRALDSRMTRIYGTGHRAELTAS